MLPISLLASLLSLAASAQTSLSLGDGVRMEGGNPSEITLTIASSTAVSGLQFVLRDTPDLFTMEGVRATGQAIGAFDLVAFEETDGTATVIVMSTDPGVFLLPGGQAGLEIDLVPAQDAGHGTVSLELANVLVVDDRGQPVPLEVRDGTLFDPAQPRFDEVGKAAGFERLFDITCCPDALGSAWADYDSDGDPDLLQVGFLTALHENRGGGAFTEAGQSNGLGSFGFFVSPTWGDFDNDGDPDAFLLAQSGERVLMENRGSGSFEDVTLSAGLEVSSEAALSANWVDFDRDGWLDLYTNDGFLFRNLGNGSFMDVAGGLGLGSNPFAGGAWADFDNDGDADYFNTERLFRNDGAVFSDVTEGSGIHPGSAFGGWVSWADFDNDGWLDLYLTRGEYLPSSLYRNMGDLTFEDVTHAAGVGVADAIVAAWADIDNDGDPDLLVTRPAVRDDPYLLFRNNADGTFSDVASGSGVAIDPWLDANGTGHPGQTASWADFDGDGKADLYVGNGAPPGFLFRNSGNGEDNHFLTIRLVGTASNRSAIGTRVTLWTGESFQIREVGGGANAGQDSLPVEFGLGNAAQADKIVVDWPSGLTESTTEPVAADQWLTITEGTLTASGVASQPVSPIPRRVRLVGSYPNPFESSSLIRFEVPGPTRVSIAVFDILGRKVASLVEDAFDGGEHSVTWTGRSTAGDPVPSGIYILRLRAGREVHAGKLIKVR